MWLRDEYLAKVNTANENPIATLFHLISCLMSICLPNRGEVPVNYPPPPFKSRTAYPSTEALTRWSKRPAKDGFTTIFQGDKYFDTPIYLCPLLPDWADIHALQLKELHERHGLLECGLGAQE